MQNKLWKLLALAAVGSTCLFSGCAKEQQEADGNGMSFTNADLIDKYLDWQVAEGNMIYDTNNGSRASNIFMEISCVWLSGESTEKFKEWLRLESRTNNNFASNWFERISTNVVR